MKKKYSNFSRYKDVDEKKFKKMKIKGDPEYVTACLTSIIKVNKEWIVPRENDRTEKIMADGYQWLTLFPKGEKFTIIAVFNEKSEFLEFYFDIAKKTKPKAIIPYIYDLYLDIVITKENEVIFLDEEELKKALETNEIKKKDYDQAKRTADKIVNRYHNPERFEDLKKVATQYLKQIVSMK